jgi:erythronate-4-phosphate dehydrogenase
MKVVVDKGIKSFKNFISLLDGFNNIEFQYLETSDITNKKIKDTEILFVRSTTDVNKTLLNNTKIKIIGSATAGTDHIDQEYLDKNNIQWFYSPGSNALSVVNYVMASICYLNNNNLFSLNDAVGIVGYGNIGKILKKTLDLFSIKNVAYDPFLNYDFLSDINQIKNCDLISLHVPLTFDSVFPTFNLVDKAFLNEINNKILINTSRGGVVDEKSLIENNNVSYIADVWINEPTPNKEVLDYSILATPHIAGHSINGKLNGTINLINHLQKFLKVDEFIRAENDKKIRNFSKSIKLSQSQGIQPYYFEYPVDKESSKFKKSYLSNSDDYRKTFENSRTNHLHRRDIEI